MTNQIHNLIHLIAGEPLEFNHPYFPYHVDDSVSWVEVELWYRDEQDKGGES